MSNYKINLKIDGDDLKYLNQVIKYMSSEHCTRQDIIKFRGTVDREMLKNEHYIIVYYIDFFCSVKRLTRIDLDAIKRMVSIDRDMFVDIPQVDVADVVSVNKEDQGALIEQMVHALLDDIKEIEVNEETFVNSMSLLEEVINNLEIQNLIYTSTMVFYEGVKVNRKELKGREGYVEFMSEGLMRLKNKQSQRKGTNKITREYLYTNLSSGEPLFPHPLKTVQDSWGSVKAGDSLSIIAPTNVGKTTLVVNYVAEALIAKRNVALFISEMNPDTMTARIISTIGARKYGIKIPTSIVLEYFQIDKKRDKGDPLSERDKIFLKNNNAYTNNAEFIFNSIYSDSNEELGTLYRQEELNLRDMDITLEMLKKEYEVDVLLVDHINGVQAGSARVGTVERINNAYVLLNSQGKNYGIATIMTNHVPEDQMDVLMDPEADKSIIRGANSTESTRTPDNVLILRATMQQRKRGEFEVLTNKDRDSNTFFDPFLVGIHIDVGMIYDIELE